MQAWMKGVDVGQKTLRGIGSSMNIRIEDMKDLRKNYERFPEGRWRDGKNGKEELVYNVNEIRAWYKDYEAGNIRRNR